MTGWLGLANNSHFLSLGGIVALQFVDDGNDWSFLPYPGGSADWSGALRYNQTSHLWTLYGSPILTQTSADTRYVNLTGDTMSSGLTIDANGLMIYESTDHTLGGMYMTEGGGVFYMVPSIGAGGLAWDKTLIYHSGTNQGTFASNTHLQVARNLYVNSALYTPHTSQDANPFNMNDIPMIGTASSVEKFRLNAVDGSLNLVGGLAAASMAIGSGFNTIGSSGFYLMPNDGAKPLLFRNDGVDYWMVPYSGPGVIDWNAGLHYNHASRQWSLGPQFKMYGPKGKDRKSVV